MKTVKIKKDNAVISLTAEKRYKVLEERKDEETGIMCYKVKDNDGDEYWIDDEYIEK